METSPDRLSCRTRSYRRFSKAAVSDSLSEGATDMKRGLGRFVLALPLLLQGCLLDIAPAREPLDETWKARMLAGEVGDWSHWKNTPFVGRDEIRSSPIGADLTRYGIRISEQNTLGGGAGTMDGGNVARDVRAGE